MVTFFYYNSIDVILEGGISNMYVTNTSFKNYMSRIVVEKNNYKFKGREILLYIGWLKSMVL